MRRASIVRFAMISLVLGAGVFLYVAALQTSETVRFEFGSMDWDFLGNPEAFEKRNRMDGPIRYPDGSVEVIQFYGRIALDNAEIRLPYHARRSPLRLRIRCHRFGLSGSVELTVNGVLLEEFVFGETSYPWAGIQAIVPQSVAEQGPLVIGLRMHAGREPPSHLPETIGVGLDWIEVEPLSQGVRLVPMSAPLIAAALLPLLCFLFLSATRASFRMAVVGAMVAAGLSAALTHLAPAMSGMALARLWVVFPMGYGLWLLLLRRSSLAESEAAFVSRAFILVIFAQSILIFFPNHAPPDIANHLPQVEWLRSLDLTFDELHRYSSSSDPFDDGHVRPHFGVNYGAPYPPLFYIMTFATTFVHGDIRFLIEFLSVALSAALMVLVFLIARTIWDDVRVACFSVLLLVFEISIWHHAHRAHAPGTLGAFVVLFWLYFLIAHRDFIHSRQGLAIFAVFSMLAALTYPASLVQISIFSTFMALFLWRGSHDERELCRRFVAGLSLGFAGAFVFYYAPYAIQAVQKSSILLDRQAYDPPATFLFLRNQMRDTVRILRNGYPLYVTLSVVGFGLVARSVVSLSYHRKILSACGLTYVAMLVFKDPALFPMIFLHAKEDLFYAPIACLLGGLVLATLWRRGLWARVAVVAILILAATLQLRDQALNHNTLHDQRVAHVAPRELLGNYLETVASVRCTSECIELDEATRKQLESPGYVYN